MTGERGFDVIVIGAGSSGCVVAARLSEDPVCRVLLLEAGPDYAPGQVPEDLSSAHMPVLRGHNWDLVATRRRSHAQAMRPAELRSARALEVMARHTGRALPQLDGAQTSMPYPMGKVVGGGSAVNGALALHARTEDLDEWAALGNPHWTWDMASPWIGAIDRGDEHRPALPRFVPSPSDWTPLQSAFGGACAELGFIQASDRSPDGYSAIPKNVSEGRKVSAAELYLTPARVRPNLTILPHCLVDRLDVDASGRVRAVEAIHNGSRRTFRAGRVVLASGAIQSPAILMRSGIGPADELQALGIGVRASLPGVGQNLIDHASVSLWGIPCRDSWAGGEPAHQLMLEQRHRQAGLRSDLQLFMLGALPVDRFPDLRAFVGDEVAMGITVVLATPASRGNVALAGIDPTVRPRIELNCLDHEQDLERMLHGVRLAWRLLNASPLRIHMQRAVLWSDAVVDSDTRLREAVLTLVHGAWHPAGTLRMGPEHDPMAVVDEVGTVRGCSNITIADASVMPTIPGVPTNLTCMLVAERIGAALRHSHGPQGYQ